MTTKYSARKESHTRPHILFVCGRNQWRSPTAERLYRNDDRIAVRSAGVSEKSPHRVSGADIAWADLILVMEQKYAAAIEDQFRRSALPPIRSLDIPDQYRFMDGELVELLLGSVEAHIEALEKG